MAKIYGPLELAQLEWFTTGARPAAAAYAYRVIWNTTDSVIQVSDGSSWLTGGVADGSVTTAKIVDANVTNAKLANMADATIKGRASGAGTGVPTDLTATQAATIVSTVISDLSRAAGVAVHGSNTNDSGAAGYIGEYIEGLQTTPTNAPTSGAYGDGASISLTAGDWDLTAIVSIQSKANTSITTVNTGISTVSGASSSGLQAGINATVHDFPTALNNTQFFTVSIPSYRVSLASTTTHYLKILATWATTVPQFTCRISARRVR